MTSRSSPTVFVIDDNAGVRTSIQGLLKAVDLRSEGFGTAEEFLGNTEPDGQVVLSWMFRFLESAGWSCNGSWQTLGCVFLSSSSLAMAIFP